MAGRKQLFVEHGCQIYALCEFIFQREPAVSTQSDWLPTERIQAYANIELRHIPLLRVQFEPLYEV